MMTINLTRKILSFPKIPLKVPNYPPNIRPISNASSRYWEECTRSKATELCCSFLMQSLIYMLLYYLIQKMISGKRKITRTLMIRIMTNNYPTVSRHFGSHNLQNRKVRSSQHKQIASRSWNYLKIEWIKFHSKCQSNMISMNHHRL